MKIIEIKLFFTLIVLFNVKSGMTDRIKDKMYTTIEASKACYRRLNGTHQIGCSSNRGGSTGAIHYCLTQSHFDFILSSGSAPPYVPIIPTELFTLANLASMKNSKKISGLVLYPTPREDIQSFSHDNQCPNPKTSLEGSCGGTEPVWNPKGTGLLYSDIPFPVFYVEDANDLKETRDCFEKHNNFSFESQRDRVLCSFELTSFMYATSNTPTCIRRSNLITNINPIKFCDPLGDQNLWASIYPLSDLGAAKPKDEKYIFVVARLDTTSLFEKTAGANSPITGLVTLLATAKLLKQYTEDKSSGNKKNVIFALFNGETYDYIGSSRFVYEMANGNFPVNKKDNFQLPTIKLNDIELIIELSQLGNSKEIFAHVKNNPTHFLSVFNRFTSVKNVSKSLPSGSVHAFLKNRTDLPTVLLSDHLNAFTNQFYNSIYDNSSNIKYKYGENEEGTIQAQLSSISQALSATLFELVTNMTFDKVQTDPVELIDELMHCYLENINCKVHQAVQKIKFVNHRLSWYVGVEIATNLATTLAGLTLAWLTSKDLGVTNRNCTNEPRNYMVRFYNFSASLDNLNETHCWEASMNFTEAVSPAFIIEDYDWNSGLYSSWSESTWGDIRLRLFLKPSAAHENMTIAIGCIVFIASLLIVWLVKSRSDAVFVSSTRNSIQPNSVNC